MSRIALSLVLVSLFIGGTLVTRPVAAQAACVPVPAGLVSWYTGNDTFADSGPAANTGAPQGSVPFAPGRVGNGFQISAGGFVQAPDVPALALSSQITLAAWIVPNSLGGRVIDKITAGGQDGWLLDTVSGTVRLIIGGTLLNGTSPIPTGTPSFVVGTYDGTTLTVYLNGVADGSVAGPGAIPTNALPLRLGADQTDGSRFDGVLDELDIYSRALSAAEILALFNAGPAGKCVSGVSFAASVPSGSIFAGVALALLLAFAALLLWRRH